MLTAAQLTACRAAQLKIMTARLTIRRPDGPVWDPRTRQETPRPGAVVYQGRGRVEASRSQVADADTAGQEIIISRYICAVPWDTAGLRPGHIITVAAIGDAPAPDLAGRRLVITEVERAGLYVTARRVHARLLDERPAHV